MKDKHILLICLLMAILMLCLGGDDDQMADDRLTDETSIVESGK
jgi:hypothetical protein